MLPEVIDKSMEQSIVIPRDTTQPLKQLILLHNLILKNPKIILLPHLFNKF